VHFGDADNGYSYSKDKGERWRLMGVSSLRDRGMSHRLAGSTDTASVAIDPDDPNIVYVCNGLLGGKMARVFKNKRGGCFRSEGGGDNFAELSSKKAEEGVPPRKMCALGLGPGTPAKRTVAVASVNDKFYLSKDSGKSWKILKANGLFQSDKCFVRQLVFDPENGKRIFALVSPLTYTKLPKNPKDMGLFVSSDEGANWHVLLPGVSGMEFAVVTKKSSVIYVAAYPASRKTDGGVYKTTDRGKPWEKVLDVKYCMTVAVNPYNTDIVYAGAGMGWWGKPKKKIGIYRSVNGGKNWSVQDTGFRAPNVTCIAIDPSDPHIIYAGVHGCGLWQGFDSLSTQMLREKINK
jgi:Sortilin, neurotensin receptor 3,